MCLSNEAAAIKLAERDNLVGELVEALQAYDQALAMPTYGDYSGFVWPKIEMRKPGDTAWGWICEKHGLGYQGGCICCRDDMDKFRDQKDREARYARDDALRAARNKASAVLAKAREGAQS